MNNTSLQSPNTYGTIPQSHIVSKGYTIGLCVGVVIAIFIMTYISYFLSRVNYITVNLNRGASIANDASTVTIQQDGLAEDILSSYPKFTYIQLESSEGGSAASLACCICLADYKGTDLLRLLPDCGHMFHLKCVDPWLMLHATCPVCRNSFSTSPLAPAVQIQTHD